MPPLFWGENRFRFLSASRCSIGMRRSLHTGRQRDRIARLFGSMQTLKRIYFTELGISIKESPSLRVSCEAVSAVFSNSGWHERALGQELLMEWLIGPVTFYCGSAAEPSCHRCCLLSSAGLCALAPCVHFYLRPRPCTTSPWSSRSIWTAINQRLREGHLRGKCRVQLMFAE